MRTAVAVCLAAGVSALLGAVSPAPAATRAWNARLRLPSATPPMLYVQVRSTGELRLADSPEALATATPVIARDGQSEPLSEGHPQLFFPEVALPASLPGVEKLSAVIRFDLTRTRPRRKGPVVDRGAIDVRVSAARRDSAGVKWAYIFSVGTPAVLVAGAPPAQAPILEMPDLGRLKLTVETKVEGHKARLGLRVKAGDVALDKVLKGGQPASCTMQVLNAEGKVLHTAQGDLDKFGFT